MFERILKPGRKVWKFSDPESQQELQSTIKGKCELDVCTELVEFLANKSRWTYHPIIAKVRFILDYFDVECIADCVVFARKCGWI